MPRTVRLINKGEKTAYHIMTRTALDGFPFGDVEKDELVKIIKKISSLFLVDVYGFCIMSNHFHLLIQMTPSHLFSDDEILNKLKGYYGPDLMFNAERIDHFRKKLSSISNYMKEIKQTFSYYFNKRHNRRGTLWGERFKSVIVENGETIVNCLSYIDLNPLRAGLVNRPEDYRWNSIGYHFQTNNKDNFLSMDFGMKEFDIKSKKERDLRYRRYVYEAGGLDHAKKCKSRLIAEEILKKERNKNYEINRTDRFRLRTRYFTDSGIIGSKDFVFKTYSQFKDVFQTKVDKKPNPVKGLNGLYSLKRLSENI